jgi:hypothetical protein
MVPPYRSSPPHARPASGASLRRRVSGGAVAHCVHASGARFPSRARRRPPARQSPQSRAHLQAVPVGRGEGAVVSTCIQRGHAVASASASCTASSNA